MSRIEWRTSLPRMRECSGSGARKSAATRGDYRGRLRATIAFSGKDDWVHRWLAKSPATRFDRLPMIRQLPACPKTGCSRFRKTDFSPAMSQSCSMRTGSTRTNVPGCRRNRSSSIWTFGHLAHLQGRSHHFSGPDADKRPVDPGAAAENTSGGAVEMPILPGCAEPRARDRQHLQGPRLAAQGDNMQQALKHVFDA